MNRRLCWIQDIGIVLGVALYSGSMYKSPVLGQFGKLVFCLVSECPFFAHRGQIRILLDREGVARIPT